MCWHSRPLTELNLKYKVSETNGQNNRMTLGPTLSVGTQPTFYNLLVVTTQQENSPSKEDKPWETEKGSCRGACLQFSLVALRYLEKEPHIMF